MLWQCSGIATGLRADGISECFDSTRLDSIPLATVLNPWHFSRQLLVVVIGFAGDGSEVPDESNGG